MNKLFILLVTTISVISLTACVHSNTKQEDPLKNTKRLTKEGHISLYENGAFHIPSTHLYLIPPAPGPYALASELIGGTAKVSLSKAMEAAADSVYVVGIGVKETYKISGKLSEFGKAIREAIQSSLRPTSKLIILKSSAAGKELIGESWQQGKKVGEYLNTFAETLPNEREQVENERKKDRERLAKSSEFLENKATESVNSAHQEFRTDKQQNSQNWLLGYAMVDEKLDKNNKDDQFEKSLERFSKTSEENERNRQETSDKIYYLMNGSFKEAQLSSDEDFAAAKKEFEVGAKENGYTLSALRALGLWLKGTIWDFSLGAGKTAVGGIGYMLHNGLAYPIIVTTKQSYNTALLAVEYTELKFARGYEYVAPTASLALAGVIMSAKLVSGYTAAAIYKIGDLSNQTAGAATVEIVAATKSAALYIGEKSIQYVGVPLAVAGTTAGSTMTGAVIVGSGYAAGETVRGAGEVAAYGSDTIVKATAGATAVIGTAVSVAAGAAVGVYEIAQSAVVVPTMMLGSGVVITYGLATQISAQALLSVADAAYLVLSLEGEKYVVYAVRGLIDSKTDLPSGAVIDLDELRKRGEVIQKVPLSDEEVKGLVDTTFKHLPSREKN